MKSDEEKKREFRRTHLVFLQFYKNKNEGLFHMSVFEKAEMYSQSIDCRFKIFINFDDTCIITRRLVGKYIQDQSITEGGKHFFL